MFTARFFVGKKSGFRHRSWRRLSVGFTDNSLFLLYNDGDIGYCCLKKKMLPTFGEDSREHSITIMYMYKILSFGRSCKAYLRPLQNQRAECDASAVRIAAHLLHKHGRYYRWVATKHEYHPHSYLPMVLSEIVARRFPYSRFSGALGTICDLGSRSGDSSKTTRYILSTNH